MDSDVRILQVSAQDYRDISGEPTLTCSGIACGFQAVGPPWAQTFQFHAHWPSCPGVVSLSFHPDGTLASVTFKRY